MTRAADRLDLTQPHLSRVLGRLRSITGDPLLIRTPAGMVPTPLAKELATCASSFLAKVETIIASGADFDPKTARNIFRIQAIDFFAATIIPKFVSIISRDAPGIQVVVGPPRLREMRELLERGEVDVVLSQFIAPPETLYVTHLLDTELCCIVRADPPEIRGSLSLEQYVETPHVGLCFGQDYEPYIMEQKIDKVLAERNLSRTKAAQVNTVLAVPEIIARSDLVGSVPLALAQAAARRLPLQIFPVPIETPPTALSAIWHQRTHADPAYGWIRKTLFSVARDTEALSFDHPISPPGHIHAA